MPQILRKDWKALWPVVAIVAALSVLGAWLRYGAGFFGQGQPVWRGMELVEQVSVVGWVVIVAAVVHQDRILGSTQDWLVRPIRRLDLLLAKLAFIVLLAHGPLLVAEVMSLAAQGFPVPQAIAAAAWSGVVKLSFYTLPIAALAAVTRSTMELLIAALVMVLLVIVLLGGLELLGAVRISEECGSTTCWTGLAWLADSARMWLAAGTAAVVLALQYFRRATAASRAVIVGGIVGVVAVGLLPWTFLFALQQAVGPDDDAMRAVDVAFRWNRGPAAEGAPSGTSEPAAAWRSVLAARNTLSGAEYDEASARERRSAGVSVSVPLVVSALPAGAVLWADRIEARLVDEAGRVVFRGRGGELELRGNESARQLGRHALAVPRHVYETLGERALRLEVDYWLTLLEPAAAVTLRASGGEGALEKSTLCATQPVDDSRAVQLRCLAIGPRPSCFGARVEPATGAAPSEELLVCRPSYAPYGGGVSPLQRFGIDVAARASDLRDVLVRVQAYRASGHFVRRVVEQGFRLGEWVDSDAPGRR